MKKVGAKVAYIALGILSFFGIWPASATPIPQPQANQLNEVKTTTPLYLKHSADMIPKMSQEKELMLVRRRDRRDHYSHEAHASHYAHYAHTAHYSHYNSFQY